MAYAILRTQKLKSAASIRRSLKHAFREQDTPNADEQRTNFNQHIGAENSAEVMQKFRDRLPQKYRKDAVLCIEYLMTASPEFFKHASKEQQVNYFNDGLDWLRERHGAENVIYSGVHLDESTPHIYAYVVPRDGEKLNCKKWLGGANALSQMQTHYHKNVGQKYGLERGEMGSKARHTTIKKYYSDMQKAESLMTPPEPSRNDYFRAAVGYPTESVKMQQKAVEVATTAFVAGSRARKEAQEKMARLDAAIGRYQALAEGFDSRLDTVRAQERARHTGRIQELVEQREEFREALQTVKAPGEELHRAFEQATKKAEHYQEMYKAEAVENKQLRAEVQQYRPAQGESASPI